jgi:hypothetical protein
MVMWLVGCRALPRIQSQLSWINYRNRRLRHSKGHVILSSYDITQIIKIILPPLVLSRRCGLTLLRITVLPIERSRLLSCNIHRGWPSRIYHVSRSRGSPAKILRPAVERRATSILTLLTYLTAHPPFPTPVKIPYVYGSVKSAEDVR